MRIRMAPFLQVPSSRASAVRAGRRVHLGGKARQGQARLVVERTSKVKSAKSRAACDVGSRGRVDREPKTES